MSELKDSILMLMFAESFLGWCIFGRCREEAFGQCSPRLLQRAFCAYIWELYPNLQFSNSLQIPHWICALFCGVLWWSFSLWSWSLQLANGTWYKAPSVEKRVSVVWDNSRSSHWNHIWLQILWFIQEILPSILLPWRALHSHLPPHIPRTPQC